MASSSTTTIKISAPRQQPCLIPLSNLRKFDDLSLFVTQLSMLLYNNFTQDMNDSPKLKAFKHFTEKDHFTVSKAFSKYISVIKALLLYHLQCVKISVFTYEMYPTWSGFIIFLKIDYH